MINILVASEIIFFVYGIFLLVNAHKCLSYN